MELPDLDCEAGREPDSLLQRAGLQCDTAGPDHQYSLGIRNRWAGAVLCRCRSGPRIRNGAGAVRRLQAGPSSHQDCLCSWCWGRDACRFHDQGGEPRFLRKGAIHRSQRHSAQWLDLCRRDFISCQKQRSCPSLGFADCRSLRVTPDVDPERSPTTYRRPGRDIRIVA